MIPHIDLENLIKWGVKKSNHISQHHIDNQPETVFHAQENRKVLNKTVKFGALKNHHFKQKWWQWWIPIHSSMLFFPFIMILEPPKDDGWTIRYCWAGSLPEKPKGRLYEKMPTSTSSFASGGCFQTRTLGVSKNRGETPKMDGFVNGKPLSKWMIGGENPLFSETSIKKNLKEPPKNGLFPAWFHQVSIASNRFNELFLLGLPDRPSLATLAVRFGEASQTKKLSWGSLEKRWKAPFFWANYKENP